MRDRDPERAMAVTPARWVAALGDPKRKLLINRDYFGHHPHQQAWRGPLRRVEDHVIYLVVDGSGGVTVGRRTVQLRGGSFLWLPPGVLHQFHWSTGFSFYNLRFRLLHGKADLCLSRRPLILRQGRDLRRLFDLIVGELQFPLPYHEERLRALLLLLSVAVLRHKGRPRRGTNCLSSAQGHRLSQYIQQHLHEHPTPADLARELHLSPDYFSRIFRRTFGIPPRQWLMRERVRLAAQRLAESSLSIAEVAYEFGYESPAFFSRQFKQVMGRSPKQFRAKM